MSQQPAEIDTEYTWPPATATAPQAGDRYDLRTANERIAARLDDLARALARHSVNVRALGEETRRITAEVARLNAQIDAQQADS